jgi:methyl-accepting chemotaxis protein WspA
VTLAVEKTYPLMDTAIELQSTVEKAREAILAAIEEDDAEGLEKNLAKIEERFRLAVEEALTRGPEEEIETIHASFRAFVRSARLLVRTFGESGMEAVQADLPVVAQGAADLTKTIADFREQKKKALTDDLEGISAAATNSMRVFLGYGLCFGAVMALVLAIGYRTTGLIARVSRVAQQIAGGELGEARASVASLARRMGRLSAREETAQLFEAIRTMTQGLHSLVAEVQKSGVHITKTASGMAASARDLEAMVTEQAAATRDVTATAQSIAGASAELARTVGVLSSAATSAGHEAEDGRKALGEMGGSMQRLIGDNEGILTRLSAIREKTSEISGIVTAISKVADRTNLLSLNASIEAEKAGEYGLGFSVVAQEIRRLADQTAVAALEIEHMVGDVLVTVSEGLRDIQRFTEEVTRVAGETRNVQAPLERIIAQIEEWVPSLRQVDGEVRAQAERARHISESMGQLSAAAHTTSTSFHSFNAGSGVLNEASRRLEAEISRFRVDSSSHVPTERPSASACPMAGEGADA